MARRGLMTYSWTFSVNSVCIFFMTKLFVLLFICGVKSFFSNSSKCISSFYRRLSASSYNRFETSFYLLRDFDFWQILGENMSSCSNTLWIIVFYFDSLSNTLSLFLWLIWVDILWDTESILGLPLNSSSYCLEIYCRNCYIFFLFVLVNCSWSWRNFLRDLRCSGTWDGFLEDNLGWNVHSWFYLY